MLSQLVALLLALSAFAGSRSTSPVPKTNSQIVPGYNASARINVQDSWKLYTSASFLYWQPIQENMELGIVSNRTNSLDTLNGHTVALHFEYKPGFQIGLGMHFDYDRWDTCMQYTYLRGSHHVRTSLDPSNPLIFLLPMWQAPATTSITKYFAGSEMWKMHLDLFDWDLTRSYYVGRKLTFRPFCGARAAWIRQYVHVSYLNEITQIQPISNTYDIQNSHSWGVGPRAGLSAHWKFGHGISFYAEGEADILFTQYTNLRWKQFSTTLTGAPATIRNRFFLHQKDANYLRTHLEMALGFAWGTFFADNTWHVDLSADYGFQVFFDQNMFRLFVDDQALAKSLSPNGNLYIHGLTAALRFDF